MPEVIEFYSVTDEYGWCSNFAPFPIQARGQRWLTTEHFFQAQKFADAESQEEIRQAKSPMLAARLGRERTRKLRADWEAVKDDVMREALRAKFQQHEDLARQLLATGEATLVEHTGNDAYWGDGGDGRGQNMLGRLLMEIRAELRRPGSARVTRD